MQDSSAIAALRLQLLSNGYMPLANRDKRSFLKGWPTVVVTPDVIQLWSRRKRREAATGIRVENHLAVIDLDIDHPVIEDIAAAIEQIVPEGYLLRRGKGYKEAWFVRTAELFSRIHTRRWVAPGVVEDDGTHSIEIFGGGSPRQFGAFGAHTLDDNGNARISYEWDGPSPADTPLASLPELTKEQFFLICDTAERMLEKAGFTFVKRSVAGESEAVRVYDLTDDMVFDLDTGESDVPLADVAKRAGSETLRCSARWLEGDSAVNRSRCLIGVTRAGHLMIWESASGTTHMEASKKPIDRQELLDRAAEALKALETKQQHKIDEADDGYVVAAKIRETYVFNPASSNHAAVPLWASELDAGLSVTAFRQLMLPYVAVETGPRGGEKRINPVDMWMSDRRRYAVDGVRMAPDQPRPTFEEDGQTFLNVYDPPLHDAEGGDAGIGWELIEQILPDATEREWFTQWLAYKFMNPDIPGPAVILVAASAFGTGRGTLATLLEKLFGQSYVRTLPFHIFAGQTYQSQYNDWLVGSVVAFVNESADTSSSGGSTYKTKVNTYEHLKELIDPRPRMTHIVRKGENSYRARTHASFIIATNHRDALPLPPGDRRFAVLTNGQPREQAFWTRIHGWLEDPANIAAFARALEQVDLTGYNPYAPPIMTTAKQTMIDLAGSELDHAVNQMLEEARGALFTTEQVLGWLRTLRTRYSYDYPDNWQVIAKRLVLNRFTRIGHRNGKNWLLPHAGLQVPVYAVNAADADLWTNAAPADAVKELSLNEPDAVAPGAMIQTVFGGVRT